MERRVNAQADKEHVGALSVRRLPIIVWLPQYQRNWLRPDVVAGLTLAAYAVPVSVAYASLAGLPRSLARYAAAALCKASSADYSVASEFVSAEFVVKWLLSLAVRP